MCQIYIISVNRGSEHRNSTRETSGEIKDTHVSLCVLPLACHEGRENIYLLTTGISPSLNRIANPVSALVGSTPLLTPGQFLGSLKLCYRPEALDVQDDEGDCDR